MSDQDYRFFAACQELDKREVQAALKVKEEESRILTEANETLTKAQQKANRKINLGSKILFLCVVGATIAGSTAFNATQILRETQEATRIEKEGASVSQKYWWNSEETTEDLLLAMRAGQLAELKGSQRRVTEVIFSSDGQRIATIESKTARIWDLSGRQIALFEDFRGFSPDGQNVATQGYGTVHLQRVRGLNELLGEGCHWLKDYFVSHPEALKELKVCQKR